MSHKLVSLYIGDGEYYTRTDADAVIAELEKRIDLLKDKANYNEYAYKRKSEELADKVIADLKTERNEYRYNLSCARNEIHNMQAQMREDIKTIAELKAQKAQVEDDCAYWKIKAQKNKDDKYISELKKERDWLAKDRAQAYDDLEKRAQLNIRQEESIRHQKYKRCLAMAKWCELKRVDAANYRIPRQKWEFYEKWHNRWQELAEKFEEAK